jgi:hypothetical protein
MGRPNPFDKTAFVKFNLVLTLNNTFMKQNQNKQKSIGNSLPAYGFKNLKKKSVNGKSQDFCQIFVFSNKNPIG